MSFETRSGMKPQLHIIVFLTRYKFNQFLIVQLFCSIFLSSNRWLSMLQCWNCFIKPFSHASVALCIAGLLMASSGCWKHKGLGEFLPLHKVCEYSHARFEGAGLELSPVIKWHTHNICPVLLCLQKWNKLDITQAPLAVSLSVSICTSNFTIIWAWNGVY